jgi:hypothetical protein
MHLTRPRTSISKNCTRACTIGRLLEHVHAFILFFNQTSFPGVSLSNKVSIALGAWNLITVPPLLSTARLSVTWFVFLHICVNLQSGNRRLYPLISADSRQQGLVLSFPNECLNDQLTIQLDLLRLPNPLGSQPYSFHTGFIQQTLYSSRIAKPKAKLGLHYPVWSLPCHHPHLLPSAFSLTQHTGGAPQTGSCTASLQFCSLSESVSSGYRLKNTQVQIILNVTLRTKYSTHLLATLPKTIGRGKTLDEIDLYRGNKALGIYLVLSHGFDSNGGLCRVSHLAEEHSVKNVPSVFVLTLWTTKTLSINM